MEFVEEVNIRSSRRGRQKSAALPLHGESEESEQWREDKADLLEECKRRKERKKAKKKPSRPETRERPDDSFLSLPQTGRQCKREKDRSPALPLTVSLHHPPE